MIVKLKRPDRTYLKEDKRSAIFIDRDGTLVEYVPLLSKIEDLKLYPFSALAVEIINNSAYLGIIVTNQPVVAMNLCDIETVKKIHQKMETLLVEQGCYVDDIFFVHTILTRGILKITHNTKKSVTVENLLLV